MLAARVVVTTPVGSRARLPAGSTPRRFPSRQAVSPARATAAEGDVSGGGDDAPRSRGRRRVTRRAGSGERARAQRARMDILRRSTDPPPAPPPPPPPPAPDGRDLFGDDFPFGAPNAPSARQRRRRAAAAEPAKNAAKKNAAKNAAKKNAAKKNTENPRVRANPSDPRRSDPDPARGSGGWAPAYRAMVAVEGVNDVRAVRAAVHPTLGFAILKGTYDNKAGHHIVPADVIRELSDAVRAGGRVVVLTDADVAGRQLRSRIVQQVPGAWHAFLGAHETTAERDTKHHKAGNVGVEHAAPEAIRKALNLARPAASEGGSSGTSRSAFDKARVAEWGLCAAPGEAAPDEKWRAFGGVRARRRLVGERLGVGDCDAKQLIRQLNLFFEEEEVARAMDALPGEGEPVPEKTTDGMADRARGSGTDDEPEFDVYAYVPPGQAPPGFR